MSRFAPYQVDAFITKTLIHNLHIESSSASQVVIKAGSAVGSDDGAVVMSLSSDITVDITNSGTNGLDTGSETANTWYYIYLIWNSSDGTVAGLLSASATAPVLPSGYTKKRLVGAVRNNSSSSFIRFTQYNNYVTHSDITIASGALTSWTTINLASIAPTDLSVSLNIRGYVALPGSGHNTISIQVRKNSSSPSYAVAYSNRRSADAYAQADYDMTSNLIFGKTTTIQYYVSDNYNNPSATIYSYGYMLDL